MRETFEQKVIFKVKNTSPKTLERFPFITIGEIEMRNDSVVHFREIKFWMSKDKTFKLLKSNISLAKKVKSKLFFVRQSIKNIQEIWEIIK